MACIRNFYENGISSGIAVGRIRLCQNIEAHWKIFHAHGGIFRVIISPLEGSRNGFILIVVFHDRIQTGCICLHTACGSYPLSVLPVGRTEGKHLQLPANRRKSILCHRLSL